MSQLAGGDAPESAQRATVSAIKKARYSPKFEAGEPVETQGVILREKILVKAKARRRSSEASRGGRAPAAGALEALV